MLLLFFLFWCRLAEPREIQQSSFIQKLRIPWWRENTMGQSNEDWLIPPKQRLSCTHLQPSPCKAPKEKRCLSLLGESYTNCSHQKQIAAPFSRRSLISQGRVHSNISRRCSRSKRQNKIKHKLVIVFSRKVIQLRKSWASWDSTG